MYGQQIMVVGGVCLISFCARVNANDTTTLVRNGEPLAALVLPKQADPDEELAAQEFQAHVRRMSGAQLATFRGRAPEGLKPIRIGLSLSPEAETRIQESGDDPASFQISVEHDQISLAGLSPQGTLHAVYELLEQLGVRWFNPGEIGTVIPSRRTVAVGHQQTIQHPGFAGRRLTDLSDSKLPTDAQRESGRMWFRRMRMGGFNAGGHGLGIKADAETEPKLFVDKAIEWTGKIKIKVSHPEVLRRAIEASRARLKKRPDLEYLSIGPADGHGFGKDPWDAGDMDPLHGKVSVSDRYVKFFNLVLEELQRTHSDVGIAFYCYSQHMRPPVREQPNPKILPVLAPIDVCSFHSIDNPICPERAYIKKIVDGWKALGVRMMYRGYLFNLGDQGMPFSMIRQIRSEYPYYHEQGMLACRVECKPAWSYHGPSLYLAAKIMWNPGLDVDVLLEDYFSRFYGPAAEPMQKHFQLLEDAYASGDYHTGNVFDIPKFLTPEVMRQLDATLRKAERAAHGDPVIKRRVNMVRIGYAFGAANLHMMAAVNEFEFIEAKRQLDSIRNDIIPRAMNHDPPLLNVRYAEGFVNRFWATTVEEGYERGTGGNEIVARLPDQWLFQLDPLNAGEDLGFYRPRMGVNNWTPIKTKSTSWSNQGLRYYKGESWYRANVEVHTRFACRVIRLWIGGVDERAQAWINGQELPLLAEGLPPIGKAWEFDASDAVVVGGSNIIVVKVVNQAHNGLGCGGITGPAMLWAPQ